MDLVDALRQYAPSLDQHDLVRIVRRHDQQFLHSRSHGPRIIYDPQELDPTHAQTPSLALEFLKCLRKRGSVPPQLPWDGILVYDHKGKVTEWFWHITTTQEARSNMVYCCRSPDQMLYGGTVDYVRAALLGMTPTDNCQISVDGEIRKVYRKFQKITYDRVFCFLQTD